MIHSAMGRMSSAEKRVARTVLADYPSAALGTATALATRSAASTASVLRFCNRLGLDGFAQLNRLVREELSASTASPLGRARTAAEQSLGITDAVEHRAALVASILDTVPVTELDRVVELLADTSRSVITVGGRISHLWTRYLQLQLRHVRPRVQHLDDPLQLDIGALLDLRRNDVLVLFDFRRYEDRAVKVAEMARQRGATVILITDVWLSPVGQTADVVIPVEVEASFFDSFASVLVLIESIVPLVAQRIGGSGLKRMGEVEAARLA